MRKMYPVSSILTTIRLHLALVLLAVNAAASAPAQSRNLILLDPAHGANDRGATIGGAAEKDLTLAFAADLRTLLTARNFTVASTRDADLALTSDQRAATANHLRPAVCLILHATASGNGVHIVFSSLQPVDVPSTLAPPWETAQAAFLSQSQRLANSLGLAMLRLKLPVTLTPASLRPLDNLTCPAVAIEIAPLGNGARSAPPNDAAYQRRVAEAIAYALTDWRNALPAGPQTSGSGQ